MPWSRVVQSTRKSSSSKTMLDRQTGFLRQFGIEPSSGPECRPRSEFVVPELAHQDGKIH